MGNETGLTYIVGIFYRGNHWTSSRMNKKYKPMTLHNMIIYITILDLATIQKNID